jgi:hypothetical protein
VDRDPQRSFPLGSADPAGPTLAIVTADGHAGAPTDGDAGACIPTDGHAGAPTDGDAGACISIAAPEQGEPGGETPRNDLSCIARSSLTSARKNPASSSSFRFDDDDVVLLREKANEINRRLFPKDGRGARIQRDRRLILQLAALAQHPEHAVWIENAIQATEEAKGLRTPLGYIQKVLQETAPEGVNVQRLRWSVRVPSTLVRRRARESEEPP